MRLWSLHPKYLDSAGLVALWREGLLAKKVLSGQTQGYRHHPQLERFRRSPDPLSSINQYLSVVYYEGANRGFNFDKSKIDWDFALQRITVTRGQVEYESRHLLAKLKTRDPALFKGLHAVSDIKPNPLFKIVAGGIESWEKVKSGTMRYAWCILLSMLSCNLIYAHCDTKDGPVVADARKAIEQNNVNYVLKWVQPAEENAIKEAFDLMMKVRVLSAEAKDLSENYFFETLVRIHRTGEGVPYTGVKPSGTPIDEKILAADKSIETGNLTPLKGLVPEDRMPELKKRFDKVMALKNYDVNNVPAGREYIEAYVNFFHFAEGEEGGHDQEHEEGDGHMGHIPWILAGIFFLTTVTFSILYFRKK